MAKRWLMRLCLLVWHLKKLIMQMESNYCYLSGFSWTMSFKSCWYYFCLGIIEQFPYSMTVIFLQYQLILVVCQLTLYVCSYKKCLNCTNWFYLSRALLSFKKLLSLYATYSIESLKIDLWRHRKCQYHCCHVNFRSPQKIILQKIMMQNALKRQILTQHQFIS